ncbi:protein of unknown function (DUF6729) [Plasmodiophora brassicae]
MDAWAPTGVVGQLLRQIAEAVDGRIAAGTLDRGKCWVLPQVLPAMPSGSINPDAFYHPNVFVWLPDQLCPDLTIACPTCGSTGDLESIGWSSRRIIDIDTSMFILAREFKCLCCARALPDRIDAGMFTTCDPSYLKSLPTDLQAAFPAIMVQGKVGGLSRRAVGFIQAAARANQTLDQIRNVLLDMHMSRYVQRKSAFEAGAAQAIQRTDHGDGTGAAPPRFFSKFEDQAGYAGFVPPLHFLAQFVTGKAGTSADALVVTATEAVPAAQALLPNGFESVCGSAECAGFNRCTTCQAIQLRMTTGQAPVATTAIKVDDQVEVAVVSAASGGAEARPQPAIVSSPADKATRAGDSAPSTPDRKRKRRPRRCQNRQMIDGQLVVCGLQDCPGRGGQKFCKNFVGNVKQRHADDDQTYKLSTLAKLAQTDPESEAAAVEALQNMV